MAGAVLATSATRTAPLAAYPGKLLSRPATPAGVLRQHRYLGLGGTGFWVDPERDVTFVFLRSGLLEHFSDTSTYQRLSDMAIAAVI